MSESTYSQRYAAGDSNTAGSFAFDTISAKDYAVSKLAFGAIGAVTYVSASDPLPITVASLPLPSGAATSAKQDTIIGHVDGIEALLGTIDTDTGAIATSAASIDGKITACNTGAVVVSSSALPSGASTAAKQPALGTAGTASADVITIQGIASMTAVKVDGSAVTQPISGTVTVNAGTNLNTSALALESGGNLAAAATSLAAIDDWDESDRAKVNVIVGQAGIAAGAGAVGATVPRVTLASDDPGVALLTTIDADTSALAAIDYATGADVAALGVVGNGAAATAVRVTLANDSTGIVSLTTSTASIGKLAANSGVDIGDVDVLTINGVAPAFGSGTRGATVQRVTIATDDVVPVSQSGTWNIGSITTVPSHAVTNAGTFAVQVDGTALTRLTDIETNTDSGAVVGNGTAATAQRVTIANDSTGILAGVTTVTTVTTCSTVTNLSQMGGQAIAMGTGTRSAGTQRVTIATDDVVLISDNSGSITVDMPAVTTGGASLFRSIDLDESEEEVKASAGTLYGGVVMNLATSVRFLKVYNATAANVTVGTTTPVMTIPIPTQAGTANGAGFVLPIPSCGVAFDTAITVAATTGVADADTGAPGANEVVVNLFYK